MSEASASGLACEARLNLRNLPHYIDRISDRLQSFDADASQEGQRLDFRFAFGDASLDMERLVMRANAADRDGLARIKDLLATAVEVYAKEESPEIVWTGDLAEETRLAQFREMVVTQVGDLTPRMRRIRFAGEDLTRFAKFGGMHIRVLFPTRDVPDPLWPVLGSNGLPGMALGRQASGGARLHHPGPRRRKGHHRGRLPHPPRRQRRRPLGHAGGARHEDRHHGAGRSSGATGVMVSHGRRRNRPAGAGPHAGDAARRDQRRGFREIADHGERQVIDNATGIELHWLPRNGVQAGTDDRLARAIQSVAWPTGSAFGWFAAEAAAARTVREHWRGTLALGRNETLAAAYWRRGAAGLMAG